jgi:hypothetical protein
MNKTTHSKNRVILGRAFALLALPVALSAMVTMAKVSNPQASSGAPAADTFANYENLSMAEQVFRSDWGSASPEVYTRIAQAFDSSALENASLSRVECRKSLCKVVFEVNQEIQLNRVLPRQLARSFGAMVTVHPAEKLANETLVYIDIPSNT